jgi:predicted aspartyl protease
VTARSSEAVLAKIVGAIDDLGRPVVRVEVPGRDGFLAVVDTGFNRSLLLQAAEAAAMGFIRTDSEEIVELGTTARASVVPALGTIRWLDRTLQVEAFVSDEPAATNRPDTARALLGTALLADCLLLVDFSGRVVEIETT